MEAKKIEAKSYAEKLIKVVAKKIDVDVSKYDMDEMIMGMLVELEHGSIVDKTNVTDDDPIKTFQIMLAHLNEIPDYYTRLKKMEDEAESVDTETEKYDEENENNSEKEIKKENISKRFKELCGLIINENKNQLRSVEFQDRVKKNVLNEEIDKNKFDIIKFDNDGIGKDKDEEEVNLYKMDKKKKGN